MIKVKIENNKIMISYCNNTESELVLREIRHQDVLLHHLETGNISEPYYSTILDSPSKIIPPETTINQELSVLQGYNLDYPGMYKVEISANISWDSNKNLDISKENCDASKEWFENNDNFKNLYKIIQQDKNKPWWKFW